MTLSINDFANATAFPCGSDKKEARAMLKEIPELANVKVYSIKDTVSKGSQAPSIKRSVKTL